MAPGILLVLFAALTIAPCCAAPDISIHTMVVGGKTLKLSETYQLTRKADGRVVEAAISPDGKTVAYLTDRDDTLSLCLIRTGGGKATVVMSGTHPGNARGENHSEKGHTWIPRGGLTWSPDGKLLALQAEYVEWTGKTAEHEAAIVETRDYMLVLASNGAVYATLAFDKGNTPQWRPMFTPDSKALVTPASVAPQRQEGGDHTAKPCLLLFELPQGVARTVYSQDSGSVRLVGWRESGRALLCVSESGNGRKLLQVPLDGSAMQTLSDRDGWCDFSPDGRYGLLANRPGIVVGDTETGAETPLVTAGSVYFSDWAPNSRMLVYSMNQPITDAAKQRGRGLHTLWLASLSPSKLNTMCFALDADSRPTWSRDCTKAAYTQDGVLWVSEITLREPTAREKLALGLPLTEDEEKTLLMQQGKEIGVAIQVYWNDYDGNLPDPNTAADDLMPYMRDRDTYLRPGTDQMIFRYIAPEATRESDIANISETIIGELDPGVYSWKVLIYADSHVKLVPK